MACNETKVVIPRPKKKDFGMTKVQIKIFMNQLFCFNRFPIIGKEIHKRESGT